METKKAWETWLYDEDRWPSGSAGGMVTREPRYRAMFLEMNQFSPQDWKDSLRTADTAAVLPAASRMVFFPPNAAFLRGSPWQEGETAVEFRTR